MELKEPPSDAHIVIDMENPGVAQDAEILPNPASASRAADEDGGAPQRERAHTTVEQRTQKERIRLGDCKNVIELMDEVKQGKLRATLAALEAGNFGGVGCLGQAIFTAVFLGCFTAVTALAVLMPTEKFFANGFAFLAVIGVGFGRCAWYLRQLEQQLAAPGQDGAAGGQGDKGTALRNATTIDRLNRAAHFGLTSAFTTAIVLLLWFGANYYVSGGDNGLGPIFPDDPSTAFFACCLAGTSMTTYLVARLAWLLSGAHTKEAQTWLVRAVAWFGFTLAVLAAFNPDTTAKISLGSVCAVFFIAAGTLVAYLRHRQNAAMTNDLKQDIAKYEQVWGDIEKDPIQLGYVRSIEAKLAAAQDTAKGKSVARPTFELEQRSTAEQLVILLAQAWGLNDTFQNLANAWKAKLRGNGHLAAAGAPDEQEQGLLPKRRKRAIEKVWRGYKGDATRLRDLVRCSLVFDSVEHLEAGIDVILTDPTVSILRVKNRFASTYNAEDSCGYRDIQLNAVVTPQSFNDAEIELGLHEHVCEIQLHLKPMYDLKNDAGHKRYVKYRNERAE
jgi:hypothetical protein